MEKFAVDLEKVLDEFEFNEEREENVSAPSIKTPSLSLLGSGALKQVNIDKLPVVRPPAANYRRPSFEPINLADADFAASPPKSSTPNFNHELSGKRNENDETFAFRSNKSKKNNRNYVQSEDNNVSSLNNEVNINKQIFIEPDNSPSNPWQPTNSSVPNEEKPDLLEYNSKNADLDSNNLDSLSQLPDITTSVRTLSHCINNNEVDILPNSLDLISSTSGNVLLENDSSYLKTESTPCEESVPDSFEDSYLPEYKIYQKNNIHNDSIAVASAFEPYIKDTNTHLASFISSDSQLDVILRQEISIPDTIEDGENTISRQNGCELQVHNTLETTELQSLGNYEQEEKLDQSTKNIESVEDAQSEKPIGFSVDTDLSDGELEEYLKELEVLDECLDYGTEGISKDTSLGVGNHEMASTFENRTSSKSLDMSIITVSNISASENSDFICDDDTTKDQFVNNYDRENKSSLKENALSYACSSSSVLTEDISGPCDEKDALGCNSSSNLPESVECSNEINSSLTEGFSGNCNSLEGTSGKVVLEKSESQNLHNLPAEDILTKNNVLKSESKSTNPFDNEDTSTKNNVLKNESKSTNPFDNEDIDEETEVSRKSTNPFDNDDNEIQNESNQSSSACHSENESSLNEEINICRKDKENWAEDVKSISEMNISSNSLIVMTSESADSSIQDVNNLSSPGTLDQNVDSKSEPIVEGNTYPECSPCCSSAPSEQFDNASESAKMIPIKAATESPSVQNVDEAGVVAEEDKPLRPNSLELARRITVEHNTHQSPGELQRELDPEDRRLGKISPFWVPDADTTSCMQCQLKFNVIKRRHHCRACGQVLCYKCCGLKARLEYMDFAEARVCQPCFTILEAVSASESASPLRRQPNPNNPMEYCSTIPPLQQAAGSLRQPPPSVMVPVGVLKREGRSKSEVTKQVMFSDGIRPGGDLTELDGSGEPRMPYRRPGRLTKRVGTPPGGMLSPSRRILDPTTHSFIPAEGDSALPPVVSRLQGELTYTDLESPISLNQPTIKFALNRNLFVIIKRVLLDCCVNRECWCFSTEGLACVGQDEIVFLLECLPQETLPPKDVFLLINHLYQEAAKGSTVSEMSFTPATSSNLLGSRDHGGFLYIRTSYQCTAQLVVPSPPYLVALLIHRWETPWAKLFPIRLVLRLGAEFRYYPCPLVSVRNRQPMYTDIGHTIINILADFRKYSYSLPSVRGLVIHMEDRQTTINIPRNRYDQVVRALNNSNDSVLAFGANLSLAADSHLVCMQSTEDENASYHTQAINIHNKPRRVTGASFVVFNGALKVPGLAGKSNIVEDGLMVQVPGETMVALRTSLRDMRDHTIGCGPNAEETVVLQWTADDTNFNIGVKSCVDGKQLDGVPSIRVHNGTDYSGGARIIRWTEVFILQCEDSAHSSEPLDISRLSESISRATCLALVPLLDLLSAASLTTLAVRATIHPDNVGYEAGSKGEKLPPLYMKSLDDELVAVVHQAALASQENPAVLELVFRIMEQG